MAENNRNPCFRYPLRLGTIYSVISLVVLTFSYCAAELDLSNKRTLTNKADAWNRMNNGIPDCADISTN